MKLTMNELRKIVEQELVEARKKTKKKDDEPVGYKTAEALDFSKPQGEKNRYKRQGASNLGPYTSEGALRFFVRECIQRSLVEKAMNFKKLKSSLKKNKKSAKDRKKK